MDGKPAVTNGDHVPFYPDHFRTEAKVVALTAAVLLGVGALAPLLSEGLGAPADPFDTPLHVKPEWYFLALYQVLKFVPKTAGAVFPVVAVGLIGLWPFIDRAPETSRRPMRIRAIAAAVAVVTLAALTVWGAID